ncbi:hypothetical protein [Psychrobacter sp. I-STPA10]|uniref:hypothetical protein n=1 Tax=Psychrobacter sp. I-STPA10 TaxID=2585769 RepID=UPI001E41E115|nr:hypothetical protein [Psychrobacter sp. I-STPA10]
MKIQKFLANMLTDNRIAQQHDKSASIHDVDRNYELLNQQGLGNIHHKDNKPRTRQQIYTMWDLMLKDPQIGEALGLHVTAALGGHESTGDTIFITPHERVRGKGRRAEDLRKKVEREEKTIGPLLNRYAFALCRQAIVYGDSYARIYSDNRRGVYDLMNNRHTAPPLIMPFEQGGKTIGFHALEDEDKQRTIAKLNPSQLLRVKMQRVDIVPQVPLQVWQDSKILTYDIQSDCPLLPADVGGSFLYQIEEPWKDVTIARAGLNNQQIADSVRQAFLTMNMEGMPPAQQKKYKAALEKMLINYRDKVEEAFEGGEALYGTQYHVMPQWGEKQILQSVGDLSQRSTPLNEGTLMVNLRRLAGGLGIDLSLIGWADMLAGGLGDGAAFYTSAQIMRRSTMIRQALIDAYNHIMSIHWGIKYGEYFKDGEYPWAFDFYSDQNAAATQALNNKQNRANTTMMTLQTVAMLKETNMGKEVNQLILEDDLGMDMAQAEKIAEAIEPKPMMPIDGQNIDNQAMGETRYAQDDDLPDELGLDDE